MKNIISRITNLRVASFAAAITLLFALSACHTTEENYKASYDKAVEKTKEGIGADTYAKIVAEQNRKTDVAANKHKTFQYQLTPLKKLLLSLRLAYSF